MLAPLATLFSAALATAAFVTAQRSFHLEDEPFLLWLAGLALLAAALSLTASLVSGRDTRVSIAFGVAGFLLVPVLYVVYLVVFVVAVCLVGGRVCYS